MDNPKPAGAPLDKISQFLKAVKGKHYDAALQLSNDILIFEPNNSVILAYRPYLDQMIEDKKQDNEEGGAGNELVDSSEDDDTNGSDESDEETDEGD